MPFRKKFDKNTQTWQPSDKPRPVNYDDGLLFDPASWGLLIGYWRYAPDKLLDVLESENPHYNLEIIQRVAIRAFCRFQEVFITGARGLTKTYIVFLSSLLMGILYPGTIRRYFAPTLKQAAEIASSTYKEIQYNYPLLCSHWKIVTDTADRFEIETIHGSVVSINAMRGDTAHSVIAEEVAQTAEAGTAFDYEKYENSILPSIRAKRMINKKPDEQFPNFQKLYITSAGPQQIIAFNYRTDILKDMIAGKNAFCMDVPAEVAVLSHIRDISWYKDLKRKLAAESWLREMASVWTGSSENPIIRDEVLTESRIMTIMENRHCGDPNVFYIVGYDVSYADGANNAKCAYSVIKCEKQASVYKSDKYLKSLVFVADNPPPRDSFTQAKRLKEIWYRFSNENSEPSYIAIDAQAYGKAVLEDLHRDMGDGLPPLCCINHDLREIELPQAVPIIYPIKATTGFGGTHDSDSEMIRYAEMEFEHRNVLLLTHSIFDGVQAYKRFHHIKDNMSDPSIAIPYLKTRELCTQISNLRKKTASFGIREERISKSIQRDMWSSLKYALRMAQILEYKNLVEATNGPNPWTDWAKDINKQNITTLLNVGSIKPRVIGRSGGNRLC